ncbi:GcrA family cell cycle regulator [Streptomyces sp. 4F14]|uniref:GcrA family cell cycle regulator n=1 Tax=Streptomyces sp. 4F14 TaxID=3394380 RepID=UPI003A88E30D
MAEAPVPFSDEEIAELKRLHGLGLSRNRIARELGRSGRAVSVHSDRLGLTYDRTLTAAATEAKMQDAKARRAAIIEQLYDTVEEELAYLNGGRYDLVEVSAGTAVKYSPTRLPAQDRKALLTGIGSAMATATRLEALDTNNGVDEGISLLGQLATGLTAAYNAMNEGAGDAP